MANPVFVMPNIHTYIAVEKALKLFTENPEAWALATHNSEGRIVPANDPSAVKFSLIGALTRFDRSADNAADLVFFLVDQKNLKLPNSLEATIGFLRLALFYCKDSYWVGTIPSTKYTREIQFIRTVEGITIDVICSEDIVIWKSLRIPYRRWLRFFMF